MLFLYKEVIVVEIGAVSARCAGAYVGSVAGRTQPGGDRRDSDAAGRHDPAGRHAALRSGVRLEECLDLRVKDLDFDRHQIIVRQGKGQKDRATMLPAAAREGLTAHLADVRRIHEADLARGHRLSLCQPTRRPADTIRRT